MFVEKSRRYFTGKLPLNALLDYIGLALRPSHYQYLLSLTNSVNPHCYRTFGDVINTAKTVGRVFPCDSVEVDQTSDTVDGRGRFVESNVTSAANAQNLNIYPSIGLDLVLIVRTKLNHILSPDLAIGNVDIFPGNVDVVEEVVIHVVIVRLGVVVLDGIVLVQVESDHPLKTQLSVFVQTHQLPVNSDRSAPRGQAQNEYFPSIVLLYYGILDYPCHSDRRLPRRRKEMR